jgi:hypothetical protein
MKNSRIKTFCTSLIVMTLLVLTISPALAGDLHEGGQQRGKFHGRVEVIFTKWVTDFPNMAGVVSGDAGAGTFSGEVLNYEHTTTTDRIEALYHINGGTHPFTAHNYVTQNNLKGTAVIQGVVADGPLKGARVHGEYQVITPCGVINAQNGTGGDFCFQGTLTVKAGLDD